MFAIVLSAMLSMPAVKAGDGTCGLWKEKYIGASRLQSNATGPTPTLYAGTTAVTGLLLDATTEYVYWALHVDSADYDTTSDIVFKVDQLLAAAETASDKIDGEILCDYGQAHVDWDAKKSQTRTVAHDITTDSDAGVNHRVIYVFDNGYADNNILPGDHMYCRYRLTDVGAGHVAGVIILEIEMYYRTCYPAEPVSTFPVEG